MSKSVTAQSGTTCFNEQKVLRLQTALKGTDFSQASSVYKALAHEKRLTVLHLLKLENELCVCDIANTMTSPVPTISQYLKILKGAGLIVQRIHGKYIYYTLTETGHEYADAIHPETDGAE